MFCVFYIYWVLPKRTGRDGTRGFVTGDFSDEGLIDTLDGLDTAMYGGFQEWVDFYEKTYKFVGA